MARQVHPFDLQRLREQVAMVERGQGADGVAADCPRLPTGWGPIDRDLSGGLPLGRVHEWCGERPPRVVLMHLAARGMAELAARQTVWIGRSCWPSVLALGRLSGALMRGSIFIDAVTTADRLWAADVCVRAGRAMCVVLDGAGLDLASTRRLQLAAESGGGLCLMARPSKELGVLSASCTRWQVAPQVASRACSGWVLALRASKGLLKGGLLSGARATGEARWSVEVNHATGAVRVDAAAGDGRDAAGVDAQQAAAG